MSLILDGTNGLSDVDGSAATPAIRGSDANTGVFFGTDIVGMSTGGTERVRVDASGNVGIGTSSPTDILVAKRDQAGSTRIRVANKTASGAATAGVLFENSTSDVAQVGLWDAGTIGAFTAYGLNIEGTGTGGVNIGASGGSGVIRFATGGTTERARIDSSGNLLVGKTSAGISNTGFEVTPASGVARINLTSSGTGVQSKIVFYNNSGTYCGEIFTGSGTSTTYSTASDYRLKEDIQPMTGALARNALLNPVKYKWKIDGRGGEGFIAHQLQGQFPSAVLGEKDAVDADGNPVYQGIGTGPLDGHFAACVNELQAIITALTARVEALEGAQA